MADGPMEALDVLHRLLCWAKSCTLDANDDDEAIAALAALRRHLEPQDHVWQPIETGPKDSEYVRVWVPGLDHEVFANWRPDLGLWDYSDGDDDPVYDLDCLKKYQPSHWRPRAKGPLPAPANQEGRT